MRAALILLSALLTGCHATSIYQPQPVETYHDYQIYSPDGKTLSLEALTRQLASSDVILVGEWHTHAAVHRFQSDLLRSLVQVQPGLALSMEQFSRDTQPFIDQYLSGEIGEQTLIKEANAWPNYESSYRPLMEFAKANNLEVIAANAPRPIVRCLGQLGLDYLASIPAKERSSVAARIDTSDSPYKRKFIGSLHHGSSEENQHILQNHYASQVTWDETMAESITSHLSGHQGASVMHVAGKFHTEQGLGIAALVKKRRPQSKIAIITPVETVTTAQSDYQLKVLPPPTRYIKKENRIKAVHAISQHNVALSCKK